jgi:poly(beta-D-mannuronate) lyase
LIDSNYFAFRPELGENGAEIIRIGTSDWSMYPSNTVVENNFFEDCNGEREIISNKSFYNTYRHNTFVRCKGTLTLRHGNRCTVEGNFFFGENIPMTGGVRIIGEDHRVINNYFQDLAGEGVFSALPIMNGVPESPLNRYFQVKNALIAFNTFVNCKYNIVIGTGADLELSLYPVNSIIANNIFVGKENTVITKITEPENFQYEGNIYYGFKAGIDDKGFIHIDPELCFKENSFFRPSETSPAINNAEGNYSFIKNDIDGHQRTELKDIGCDEVKKDYISYKPLKKFDVGPQWIKIMEESNID